MMHGRIQAVIPGKNFKFLRGDNETFDRFFHGGSVLASSSKPFDELLIGDRVEFDPLDEHKPRAVNVRYDGD